MWQRRSLLLKLSGQTQLLEELAEISVDRLGAITSAADGRCQQVPCCVCLPRSVRVLSQLRAICVLLLLLQDCVSNSQRAVNRAVLFLQFVAPDLGLCSPCSSPGPRRTPTADDSLVRVQRVCRTFSHHIGQSVQTHEPALHSSAAGETPTQRRHRLYHGYRLSANKPEVTLNVTLGCWFFFFQQCCLCFTVPEAV